MPLPKANTAPNAKSYNMSWASSTLISTRLATFVCPTDAYNQSGAFFFTASDAANYPSFIPGSNAGVQLINWARGNYGSIQGATDADHTVNGDDDPTASPFPGASKTGMIGANYGQTIAAGDRRPLQHRHDRRAAVGPGLDRHPGDLGDGLRRRQHGRPRQELQSRRPTTTNGTTVGQKCTDGGDELQMTAQFAAMEPNAGQQRMGFNCGGGMYNSGGQVRSLHPGGVNVGFGDGSVKFIKNTISNQIWFNILTSKNGDILSADQY